MPEQITRKAPPPPWAAALFRLRRLGIEAVLLPSGGSEVLEGLSQARSDDLVVLFSFSKVSRRAG